MFDIKRKTIEWGGKTLTLETGRLARQADGAVLATYGETTVLATAVFMATVLYQSMVVQPRALQRRHAREAALDPAAAARRRRREKAIAWIGAVVGCTCGIGGLLLGLVSSGRI